MSLQFKLQLVVVAEDGSETTEDLVVLDKEHEHLERDCQGNGLARR